MNSQHISVSIIIIGFNTRDLLRQLLDSINLLYHDPKDIIEVLYIDDGSIDGSIKMFNQYQLQFKKFSFEFLKNQGRVIATNKGIKLASGDWLLFLQSNVVVDNQLLVEYKKELLHSSALAYVGHIIYQTKDLVFGKYLNHMKRGINRFTKNQIIPFRYLLFGNCIINKTVFNKIELNLNLNQYGGEELDFSYRLDQKFPTSIMSCRTAKVVRIEYPKLPIHCTRLFQFGQTNFLLLERHLQIDIVKFPFLLRRPIILRLMINLLYALSLRLYKLKFLSYYTIRLTMLLAILRGYYSIK